MILLQKANWTDQFKRD